MTQGASTEATPPLGGITAAVEYSQYVDAIGLDHIEDDERESAHQSLSHLTEDLAKATGMATDHGECSLHAGEELLAQTRALLVVPDPRSTQFGFGLFPNVERERHVSLRSRSRTSLQGELLPTPDR